MPRAVLHDLLVKETPRPEIRELRERVLLGLVMVFAVFGVVPVSLGILTAIEQGQLIFAALYALMYLPLVAIVVARRQIPYHARAGTMTVLGIAFSIAVLVRLGLSGIGIEMLTAFVVGATVLFGIRVGIASLFVGVVIIAAIGAGAVSGAIPLDRERLLTSYMVLPWMNAVVIFVLMTIVMALAPQLLLRRLSQMVDEREQDAADLARANQKLRDEIDQRERAETAQRSSEERFQNLVDILPETVFETDANGKFTYLNERGLQEFGIDAADVGKLSPRDVVLESEKAAQNMARVIRGEVLGLTEYTVVRRDGSQFPVLVRSSPIWRGDEAVGLRGLVIDVTERKRLEAQLHQAQKMEAIGTLAGGLAHDFNNLLMAIQGRVSLMLTDIVSDPREHLLSIEEYVRSASELTTRLLGVARSGKYAVAPTDINELVSDSLALFGRTRKELRTHADYASASCVAEVDRRQIEQVLLNLWVNAWQAMPRGGDLYVETDRVELDRSAAAAHDVDPGTYVSIRVRDTGSGMSDEVRERVFEPFFTTKEMGRGTGLGLASAYGIVRNHGGSITVESTSGAGSTFTVLLPCTTSAAERQLRGETPVTRGRGTVLLVDDEQVVREVCAALLARLGYDVVQAESGEEAVGQFRQDPDRFDLIILDLVMPARQGSEVFDDLIDIRPGVRVLLASGYSVEGEATALLERGAVGFLQKPFNLEQLSTKLKEVLG